MTGKHHCSFCGKSQDDVLVLIAAPVSAFICDECTSLAADMVDDARFERRVKEELAKRPVLAPLNAMEGKSL